MAERQPHRSLEDCSSKDEITYLAHQIICLRNVSRLLSKLDKDIEYICYTLVHLIPEGFQFPDKASVRLTLNDQLFETTGFADSKCMINVSLYVNGEESGKIEVFYPDELFEDSNGSFNQDEYELLETVALELGLYIERKLAEKARIQHFQELEIYSSLIRHDLRNDLGVVLANIDLLRMQTEDMSSDVDDILQSLEALCQRMTNLLNVFSRSAGLDESSIIAVIEKSIEWAKEANPNLTINFTYSPNVKNARILASRMLPMVFDNLLRNAAIHAGKNPTVDITASITDRTIEIIVADDGPGVSKEIRPKLFQKGVSTRGGGLGLYLSKEIINVMNGTIELVENDQQHGAVFKIILPLAY